MKTELSRTLCWEWRQTNQHQIILAPALGIAQNVLSTYISGRRYPDDAGLRALCTRWPDLRAGLRILLAHLHDRINVAGRSGEVEVRAAADTAAPVRTQVEADLATLRAEAYREDYDDVRALLHNLAELIRSSTPAASDIPLARAAESGEPGPRPQPRGKGMVYPLKAKRKTGNCHARIDNP